MAKQTIDFAKLIQEDREQRQQQQWQGTFLEYLELVKADPGLAKSAHRRHHVANAAEIPHGLQVANLYRRGASLGDVADLPEQGRDDEPWILA